jgi:hypothetical protein
MKTKKVSIEELGRGLQQSDRVYFKNLVVEFLQENNPTDLSKPLLFQIAAMNPLLKGKSFEITDLAGDRDFKIHIRGLNSEDPAASLLEDMKFGWFNPSWVSAVEVPVDQVWTLSDVLKISEVACNAWKSHLREQFFGNRSWSRGYVNLPADFIKSMRSAASAAQTPVVEGVLQRLSDEEPVGQTLPESTVAIEFRGAYSLHSQLTLCSLKYQQAMARENNRGGLSTEAHLAYRLCQTLFKDMVWRVVQTYGDGDVKIKPASELDGALLHEETGLEQIVVSPAWTRPYGKDSKPFFSSIIIPWPILLKWGQENTTVQERMTTLRFEMTPAGAVFNSAQWECLSEDVTVPQEITSAFNNNGN